MTTKLNLTINEKTAKAIKAYAEKRKISVSKLAEDYFSKLAGSNTIDMRSPETFVEKYAGIATKKLKDINKIKDEYLREKYGF